LIHLLDQGKFKQPRYQGLTKYLDSVINDYPHSLFQTEKRSSQTKANFDFSEVQIEAKQNQATRLAQLVLQAVTDTRMRHEALQQFMLVNDSVTVAMEVPIYYDLLNASSACGEVNTRKRGLGGNYVSPQI